MGSQLPTGKLRYSSAVLVLVQCTAKPNERQRTRVAECNFSRGKVVTYCEYRGGGGDAGRSSPCWGQEDEACDNYFRREGGKIPGRAGGSVKRCSLVDKRLEGPMNMTMRFVDVEKTCDSVPQQVAVEVGGCTRGRASDYGKGE